MQRNESPWLVPIPLKYTCLLDTNSAFSVLVNSMTHCRIHGVPDDNIKLKFLFNNTFFFFKFLASFSEVSQTILKQYSLLKSSIFSFWNLQSQRKDIKNGERMNDVGVRGNWRGSRAGPVGSHASRERASSRYSV